MVKQNKCLIRNMTHDEVANIAVEWAAKEGWNPGFHDSGCFYAVDPKGFFVGLLDNEPISCISAVVYDENFGFLGFYIVKPEFRGKRYGIQIWETAMEYLNSRNIGLDGVVEQQENYKRSGFRLAYRNIRYQGISSGNDQRHSDIVKLSEVSFNDLKMYDDNLFPASRPQFLKCWINQPESLALGALQNGKLAGYSIIRKCRDGYKIGPLFANNEELAEKLFRSLSSFAKDGSSIFLDVPEVNKAAARLVERHGMKVVFETARMYTKREPDLQLNKIFGVTTFELG